MKKFYESPVVEITVFDEECIMTASVAYTMIDTTDANSFDYTTQKATILTGLGGEGSANISAYGGSTWGWN